MTVVARVGLVDIVELVEVGVPTRIVELVDVGVPTGIIWRGVAVARTGVGVRRKVGVRDVGVGVSRTNSSMASFWTSLRSRGGGGPFLRVCGFMLYEQPQD